MLMERPQPGDEPEDFNKRFRETAESLVIMAFILGGVTLAIGLLASSLSLCALSAGFIEDGAVNGLLLSAVFLSPRTRRRLAFAAVCATALPPLALAALIVRKVLSGAPPIPMLMIAVGAGAVLARLLGTSLLVAWRPHVRNLVKIALANMPRGSAAAGAVAAAGIAMRWIPTLWPDAIVGAGVLALYARAPRAIWNAANARRWQSSEGGAA
ncbi:hypothetical protein [Sphingomonas oryzagri]